MDEGHCEIHRAGALCLPIYPINSWSKGIQCWLQGGEFPFIWAIVHIQPLHIYWLSVGWMKRQGTKTRHTYVLLQLTDHLIQEMKCMHQLLCNSEYSSFLTHGSLWWKLSLAPPCNAFPPWAPRTSFSGSSLSYPLLPCRHLCCFFLSSTNSKCGHAPGLSPQPSALPLLTPWMSSHQPEFSTLGIGWQLSNVHLWSCLSSELQNHMNNCFLDSHSWTSTSISEFHVQRPAS